jgi:hypothetical protein
LISGALATSGTSVPTVEIHELKEEKENEQEKNWKNTWHMVNLKKPNTNNCTSLSFL